MPKPSPLYEELSQSDAEARLVRIFEVAGCQTQLELAAILNIRQSSISDAKRRGAIPSDWLIKLFQLRGVNPDWIMKGSGPKFLTPSVDSVDDNYLYEAFPPVRAIDATIVRNILRCFPVRDLHSELQRRREKVAPESPPRHCAKRTDE